MAVARGLEPPVSPRWTSTIANRRTRGTLVLALPYSRAIDLTNVIWSSHRQIRRRTLASPEPVTCRRERRRAPALSELLGQLAEEVGHLAARVGIRLPVSRQRGDNSAGRGRSVCEQAGVEDASVRQRSCADGGVATLSRLDNIAPVSLLVSTSRMDRSGRIHERLLLRERGWEPGDQVDMNTTHGMILIANAPTGLHHRPPRRHQTPRHPPTAPLNRRPKASPPLSTPARRL